MRVALAATTIGVLLASASPVKAAAYTFTEFDVPGAVGFTAAFGINDVGQIVGFYFDGMNVGHGFLRDPSGSFTTIDVPGAMQTSANGINNFGQIVGRPGYLLTGGSFTTIDVPGETNTSANGINSFGQIVGGTGSLISGGHGFLRDPSGSFTPIDVPGATGTEAFGINDGGQIVGTELNASGEQHGFLLTGGSFTEFDVPVAQGINNAGEIVLFGAGQSLLRDPSGSFTPIDVPGAEFTGAFGLNNLGQIVGGFTDITGEHAFLATPIAAVPEPDTLSVLTISIAGLGIMGGCAALRKPR
jgi:probable HAF family extracellular repeat protein